MLSQTGWDDNKGGGQGPRQYYRPKKKKVSIPYLREQVSWEKPVSRNIAHKQETDSWVMVSGTNWERVRNVSFQVHLQTY